MMNKKVKSIFLTSITYLASILSVVILISILGYIFIQGAPLLSFDLLTSDAKDHSKSVYFDPIVKNFEEPTHINSDSFSYRFGISLNYSSSNDSFEVVYIDQASPLANQITIGDQIVDGSFILKDNLNNLLPFSFADGIVEFTKTLDRTIKIDSLPVLNKGSLSFDSLLNWFDDYKEGFTSNVFGITFINQLSVDGRSVIKIININQTSPLANSSLQEGDIILEGGIILYDNDLNPITVLVDDKAEALSNAFDMAINVKLIPVTKVGGGIRGSIITTLYLILLTLLISLPIGIFCALYLSELAPKNKVTAILRSLIDYLTGIPSIIFGLMGAALFIPLSIKLSNNTIEGQSIISGSLTLAVIILPVIIKACEASLQTVPLEYKYASLALGANETQTMFKVSLPNALPGILSAVLLSIGRIMGESAALIFALGTVIKDDITITDKGSSLAVHIFVILGGERPNFALAASISIIILAVVLVLNLLLKLTTKLLRKKKVA